MAGKPRPHKSQYNMLREILDKLDAIEARVEELEEHKHDPVVTRNRFTKQRLIC